MSSVSKTMWAAVAVLVLGVGAAQAQEITPGGSAVTASTNDGNLPANAVDNNLSTRWSGCGDGAWLQLDLGTVRSVGSVSIAFYNGNMRKTTFDLQLSSGSSSSVARTAVAVARGVRTGTAHFLERITNRFHRGRAATNGGYGDE